MLSVQDWDVFSYNGEPIGSFPPKHKFPARQLVAKKQACKLICAQTLSWGFIKEQNEGPLWFHGKII